MYKYGEQIDLCLQNEYKYVKKERKIENKLFKIFMKIVGRKERKWKDFFLFQNFLFTRIA